MSHTAIVPDHSAIRNYLLQLGEPKALRAFLCTDISLKTETIAAYYAKRWPTEVFFRQSQNNLGFDTYQVRWAKAFTRLYPFILHHRIGSTVFVW